MNVSNSTENCYTFDTNNYRYVAAISAGIGIASLFACLIVIGIIILCKKYFFFTQRLVLYLSIAALLQSLAISLRMHRLTYDKNSKAHEVTCIAVAFFEQMSAWAQLLGVSCITLHVFVKVVMNRDSERAEWAYLLLTFGVPITFNWIPFINNGYGVAGAWCWIRNQNEDNCETFTLGNYYRFIFWYIPLYLILILLLIAYFVIICKIRSMNQNWKYRSNGTNSHLQERLELEIQPLLWYPLFFILLNIPSSIDRIYGIFTPEPILALWILHAIFDSLQGGFISLAYALDSDTVCSCGRHLMTAVLGSSKHVHEYPSATTITDSLSPEPLVLPREADRGINTPNSSVTRTEVYS